MKKFIIKNRLPLIFLISLSIISFIIYFRSLKVGFLSDDYFILFDWKQFINPFSGNRWLAFQGIYYWLLTITGYHLLPIRIFFLMLFSLNIVLVFILISKITKQPFIAYLSSFIFALFYRHPMSIYWLAASHEILLMTFTLCCLILYLSFVKHKKISSLILSTLFFILALLTKESALIILPAIFLIDWLIYRFDQRKWKKTIIIYSPYIVISLAYLLISFLSTGNVALVQRGGYHLVTLKTFVLNFANILAAFLPFKFSNAVSGGLNIEIIITAILILAILFFIKKIPRYIPLFIILILIISTLYALFSPFGFQDKYLSLASFAFAGLVAGLWWLIVKNLKSSSKILLTMLFLVSYAITAIYLINYRSDQWLMADNITKNYETQFEPFCRTIKENQSKVYFINYPEFINNQVFTFNNGLGDMVRLLCHKENWGVYLYPNVNDEIFSAKSNNKPEQNILIYGYNQNKIYDLSNKYNLMKNYLDK